MSTESNDNDSTEDRMPKRPSGDTVPAEDDPAALAEEVIRRRGY